jgi:hypothetical protein
MGITKPKVDDFIPLVQRIERRLSSTSNFLNQAGRLEMVNSVLSALPTFFMGKVKLPPLVIGQIDKYRKHCVWRGSDLNPKKPPLEAWSLATKPKKERGLGILNLKCQNDALLLKNLHKFYNKADCPWVDLVWNNYYLNGTLPDGRPRGSFWWRSILKNLTSFKGIAMVRIENGSSILLWHDLWANRVRSHESAKLFSFFVRQNISLIEVDMMDNLHELFQLPLSDTAYQQFLLLNSEMDNLMLSEDNDVWSYIWGTSTFSVKRAYDAISGHSPTHPVFKLLWASKCQPKHKVFFWLLLHDKLNIKERLRRRNMELDSYVCENCILKKKTESVYHLFLRCNFVVNCWSSIGLLPSRERCSQRAAIHLMRQLHTQRALEILILMC